MARACAKRLRHSETMREGRAMAQTCSKRSKCEGKEDESFYVHKVTFNVISYIDIVNLNAYALLSTRARACKPLLDIDL